MAITLFSLTAWFVLGSIVGFFVSKIVTQRDCAQHYADVLQEIFRLALNAAQPNSTEQPTDAKPDCSPNNSPLPPVDFDYLGDSNVAE
jgi:hypothetical protein